MKHLAMKSEFESPSGFEARIAGFFHRYPQFSDDPLNRRTKTPIFNYKNDVDLA